MRRAIPAVAMLGMLAGCDSESASSAASPQELKAREFVRAMKTIDNHYEELQKTMNENKPAEEVRRHLDAIRSTAEQASTLDYRTSEAENRDLAFEFRKFLDAAGKLQGVTWAGDEGARAWRQLGIACAPCHDLYRKEKDR